MQYRKIASITDYLLGSLAGAALLFALPGTAAADCIDDAASFQHVNVGLMRAIAQVESGTQTNVINRNSDGTFDIGLMQINSSWLPRLAREGITEQSLFDPCTNAYVGAWILSENIRQFGPTWNAVGAYNASSPDKRLAYARKVYATAQSISSTPDSPMPILPPSYTPPQDYNPFASLEVNQVKVTTPRGLPSSLPMKPATAATPASANYNFGWTTSGADDAKPVQVFDDGSKIYVQFSDMKRVPAIFADTPRGRVVLQWTAQPPYAVITTLERKLIFQIGGAEANAQKTVAGATTGAAPVQVQAGAATSQGNAAAGAKPATTGKTAGATSDALWYATMSPTVATSVASAPAAQASAQTPQAATASVPQTAPASGIGQSPAAKPPAATPSTDALWYVTK
jgi:resuscitation-promoting factor RpfA